MSARDANSIKKTLRVNVDAFTFILFLRVLYH